MSTGLHCLELPLRSKLSFYMHSQVFYVWLVLVLDSKPAPRLNNTAQNNHNHESLLKPPSVPSPLLYDTDTDCYKQRTAWFAILMPLISMQKAEPSRINFFWRARYFPCSLTAQRQRHDGQCSIILTNTPSAAPKESRHEVHFLKLLFFLLKLAASRKIRKSLQPFPMFKLCWASSSRADIRHFILALRWSRAAQNPCWQNTYCPAFVHLIQIVSAFGSAVLIRQHGAYRILWPVLAKGSSHCYFQEQYLAQTAQFLILYFPAGIIVKKMTSGQLHLLCSCMDTHVQTWKLAVFLFIVIEKKKPTNKSKHHFFPKDIINIFKMAQGNPSNRRQKSKCGQKGSAPFQEFSFPTPLSISWLKFITYIHLHTLL